MSKYTFICEEESTPYSVVIESKKTIEFRADGLNDVLQQFEDFLRAAGFHFEGVLDIVNPEEENETSNWDFSNIPQNNFLFGTPTQNLDDEPEVFISEDIVLNLDNMGAGQPAMSLYTEDVIVEKCPVCKIPKSIMASERCYDKQCPKSGFSVDYDFKIASEK